MFESIEAKAIQLVRESKVLCDTEKLHLHKFFTNNKRVIDITPKDEYADGAPDLDLALGEKKLERSLGVQWCTVSGKFQFNVQVKESLFTRNRRETSNPPPRVDSSAGGNRSDTDALWEFVGTQMTLKGSVHCEEPITFMPAATISDPLLSVSTLEIDAIINVKHFRFVSDEDFRN